MSKLSEHKNLLAVILFLAVFLNGFEAGGYQACLLAIGTEFQLSNSLMGMLASAQLIATLIAPLADKKGKKQVIDAFLLLKLAACLIAILALGPVLFAVGIFLVGVSVSIIQYTSIAGLADAYPATGKRKIGIITSMYSLGAVTSPLICGALLGGGLGWRSFFIVLFALTVIVLFALHFADFAAKERVPVDGGRAADAPGDDGSAVRHGGWMLSSVLLLCLIMFVYVGVENGFAFFLNSFVQEDLGGSDAYLALSMFWLAMIPSRLLCGAFSEKRAGLMIAACIGVSVLAFAMGAVDSAPRAVALSFALGFFSGAVYPNVLSYAVDFAGGRTATATGLITAATGLGGAVIAASFGFISDACGMRMSFYVLGALMAVDIVAAIIVVVKARRVAIR